MSWLVCGTVPDDDFPLCMGTWRVNGERLVPESVSLCGAAGTVPSVPVQRGTPALVAAAVLASERLGGRAPLVLLAGDCGSSKGSISLYDFLSSWLGSQESRELEGITFHYLFPSVDGHNRILMALEERAFPRPVLIADAGFMYAAKMSGYASKYDVFTPDAGELAFLADEKAPHPFYTRGFLLSENNRADELARAAWDHGDSARILLVKGSSDIIMEEGREKARVTEPCLPFMEPIGGTGDLVTGLLTAFASSGTALGQACLLAARSARLVGRRACPNPASSIASFMPFVSEGVAEAVERH